MKVYEVVKYSQMEIKGYCLKFFRFDGTMLPGSKYAMDHFSCSYKKVWMDDLHKDSAYGQLDVCGFDYDPKTKILEISVENIFVDVFSKDFDKVLDLNYEKMPTEKAEQFCNVHSFVG